MALDNETARRVRGYIEEQAERGWMGLWPVVVSRRVRLIEAAEGLTAKQAAWSPSPDSWSAAEIMRHQLASSEGVLDIISALCDGKQVRDGRYDTPGDVTTHETVPEEDEDYRQLLDRFIEHSVEFAALPTKVGDGANLDATFPHMYFGDFNCIQWFAFQPVHDGDHYRGLRALTEHEGFPA